MLDIVKLPHKSLRKKASPVADFDDELKKLADDMAESMYADNGIGLAAPQVDVSKRILIVAKGAGKFKAYVNPEITFFSKALQHGEEGCLSIPQVFGIVPRAKKIRLKYHDLDGKLHKEKAKGLDAVVIQHEVDHLNGVLFIDKTEEITSGQELLDEMLN